MSGSGPQSPHSGKDGGGATHGGRGQHNGRGGQQTRGKQHPNHRGRGGNQTNTRGNRSAFAKDHCRTCGQLDHTWNSGKCKGPCLFCEPPKGIRGHGNERCPIGETLGDIYPPRPTVILPPNFAAMQAQRRAAELAEVEREIGSLATMKDVLSRQLAWAGRDIVATEGSSLLVENDSAMASTGGYVKTRPNELKGLEMVAGLEERAGEGSGVAEPLESSLSSPGAEPIVEDEQCVASLRSQGRPRKVLDRETQEVRAGDTGQQIDDVGEDSYHGRPSDRNEKVEVKLEDASNGTEIKVEGSGEYVETPSVPVWSWAGHDDDWGAARNWQKRD